MEKGFPFSSWDWSSRAFHEAPRGSSGDPAPVTCVVARTAAHRHGVPLFPSLSSLPWITLQNELFVWALVLGHTRHDLLTELPAARYGWQLAGCRGGPGLRLIMETVGSAP